MTINVGHLFRKRTVRNLGGGIIDMADEANGGVLVSKGRVVNQERVDELAAIEKDKQMAATAAHQVEIAPEVAEARVVAPTRVEVLEKKIEGMEGDINAILELLKNK